MYSSYDAFGIGVLIYCIVVLAVSAGLGFIPATIAKNKGYSFGLWWLYGWLLFIIALIHALVLPDKNAQRNYPPQQGTVPQQGPYAPPPAGGPVNAGGRPTPPPYAPASSQPPRAGRTPPYPQQPQGTYMPRQGNAPQQGVAPQQVDAAEELQKYKQLLDNGVITQEEFDAKKKQLLGI